MRHEKIPEEAKFFFIYSMADRIPIHPRPVARCGHMFTELA
jgi:hypothetical protein